MWEEGGGREREREKEREKEREEGVAVGEFGCLSGNWEFHNFACARGWIWKSESVRVVGRGAGGDGGG